ncbi:glycosyltransferase family 1 protein [Poronia punctata]|nr:glycosyltransferase family 1 protein [Poronia punctata]
MGKLPPTILFFTNAELGQSSVMLAVASELATASGDDDEDYDVHIASFSGLANSVPPEISFHALPGICMKDAFTAKGFDFFPRHAPGVQGAMQSYRTILQALMAPWEDETYLGLYDRCVELIEELRPDAVIVDPLLGPALDACSTHHKRYVVLSPGTFKDHVINLQPRLEVLWKYPVFSSGFSLPIPLSSIPTNIYLIYQLIKLSLFSPRVQSLVKARNEHGIPGKMTTGYNQCDPNVLHLVPATRSTDWPFSVIPPNVIGCGPILPVVAQQPLDPAFARWIAARPTLIINMGSHITYDEGQFAEVLAAIEACLALHPDIQVLWKCRRTINTAKDEEKRSVELVVDDPRIRITEWLPASPVACLTASKSVLAYVHHGGANSFYEAVAAGVPQVICPVWIDTYDFAVRAELAGIGVRGNQTAAPYVEMNELTSAFEKVVGNSPEAEDMRIKARLLAEEVGGLDMGRKVGAEEIRKLVAERASSVL